MPPKPLETGDPRALGRFELLARLGEGGQGVVYLGRGAGPSFGLQNDITFTMANGGRTARETNDTCTNTLTLAKVTATVLTFHEPQTDLCVAGTVTFTLQTGGLAYVWTDGIEKNTATLHRKK